MSLRRSSLETECSALILSLENFLTLQVLQFTHSYNGEVLLGLKTIVRTKLIGLTIFSSVISMKYRTQLY